MNTKEQLKSKIVHDIIDGKTTKEEGVKILGITVRQINRLIIRYTEEGENAFIHKNKGKSNARKISDEIRKEITDLYITEYYDYNFTHFYEEIADKYNISYKTVNNILNEEDIISPEAQHSTVKDYNKKMKQVIKEKKATEKQINIYEKRKQAELEKHIRKSSLLYNYGQEIQLDAAFAIWFGEMASALHLAVDRSTKKVLAGYFDSQETTRAYFVILKSIILNHGIPLKIKTDKRGTFSLNNARTKSNLNTTQFGRICSELEIELHTSSNPVFKPNVERENKTFKGRLIAELRHSNITTIDDANKYLNNVFIPKMNKLFSYDINKEKTDMRENKYSEEELNIIISEQYTRKIDNSSSIKYKGNYYIPIDLETGEIMSYPQNTLCTVIITYNMEYLCEIEGNLYKLLKIATPSKKIQYRKSTKTIEEINKSKAHKPSANHPWRNFKI